MLARVRIHVGSRKNFRSCCEVPPPPLLRRWTNLRVSTNQRLSSGHPHRSGHSCPNNQRRTRGSHKINKLVDAKPLDFRISCYILLHFCYISSFVKTVGRHTNAYRHLQLCYVMLQLCHIYAPPTCPRHCIALHFSLHQFPSHPHRNVTEEGGGPHTNF